MLVDFHCHTTASDGELDPQVLIDRAAGRGVELFSITDHDTVAAYDHLQIPPGMRVVPGVELSCVWSGVTVHVLGLGIDLDSEVITEAMAAQRDARAERAAIIGRRLHKLGLEGCYEGASQLAGERAVGRPDFARFMIGKGYVASMADAFDRYLGAGKVGDVKASWPELASVVDWIRRGGGVAVLAHPLHYRLTATRLRELLRVFVDAGGEAMEVSNGRPTPDELIHLRRLCGSFGLQASVGSDFHRPAAWCELGCEETLVGSCPPVWRRWV